jgi:CHAT domain-containing protein
VSSYTPTLSALLRAQQSAKSYNITQLKLLIIAADSAGDSGLPRLWNVQEESQHIASISRSINLSIDISSPSATIDQVTQSFELAHLVHIACHGIQDTKQPLDSAFYLSDKRLTVDRLMRLNLKDTLLAFLSACETAKGDSHQPDQTIHLASAMLFMGFKSVIATMW